MNNEFEDLRQQMNILKEKLQKQDIVNENVLRHSMKRNLSGINLRYRLVSALCILMIPYSYWAFVKLTGMSVYLWIATCVMMLVAFCYTLYNGRHLNNRLFEKDLVQAREHVVEAKKLDKDWLKIGIPAAILWLSYFAYEMYKVLDGSDWLVPVVICVCCAIIGGAIGLRTHARIQDEYNQLIDELDIYKKDE